MPLVMGKTPDIGAMRANELGLIVPDDLARERQVWTKDEWRLLDRATRLLHRMGLDLELECKNPACHKQPLERIRRPDGTPMLRCAHMDRMIHPRT